MVYFEAPFLFAFLGGNLLRKINSKRIFFLKLHNFSRRSREYNTTLSAGWRKAQQDHTISAHENCTLQKRNEMGTLEDKISTQ